MPRRGVLSVLILVVAVWAATGTLQALAADRMFAVQVSAFKNAGSASQEIERLKAAGISAFSRLEDTGSKGVWHRVYAGAFGTKIEAVNHAGELVAKGIVQDYTIRVIDDAPAGSGIAAVPAPAPVPASPPKASVRQASSEIPAAVAGRVDAWEIIIDLSGSTREQFNCSGVTKQEAQFTILRKLNNRIPQAPYQAALREFAHKRAFTRDDYTNLVYGIEPYDRQKFRMAVANLRPTDAITPLGWAIAAAEDDLRTVPGKKAVIILSDFKENVDFGTPLRRAEGLAYNFGDDLAIYTISTGSTRDETDLARNIAAVTPNGKSYDGCRLLTDDAYFETMATDIFGAGPPAEPVCTDADQDTVCDDQDRCPHTPAGAPVDERGCWVAAYSQFFDYDKADLKEEYLPRIKAAADIIQANPHLVVVITGHTDNMGTEAYNMKLGLKRAEAVKKQLIEFGADPARLKVKSFGESQPIASNDTEEGRAKNRRVEFNVREPGARK